MYVYKGGAGEPTLKTGLAIHMYAANVSMGDKAFYNSDGDFLIGMKYFVYSFDHCQYTNDLFMLHQFRKLVH
jgi:hypothetical protein